MGAEAVKSSKRTVGIPVLVISVVIVAVIAAAAVYVAVKPAKEEEAEPGPIKVGTIMCLSGDLGPVGPGLVKGIELAVWEVNQKGGIQGRQVELIVEDEETNPTKAMEVGSKLIDIDGVKVIVGPMISPSVLSLVNKSRDSKVVMITPSATAPSVSDAGEWVFRVCPTDRVQGKALADLAKVKGYTKVATLVLNNDYGVGLEDALIDFFEGEVVASVRFESGKADYRTELDTLKAKQPQAIMLVAYPESGTVILKQAAELQMGFNWLAAEGIADAVMLQRPEIIPELEKMLLTKPRSVNETVGYQKFLSLFNEKYPGETPGIYADYAYDAASMALMAIAYGGNDGEGIKDALNLVGDHFNGASGDKTFDANGDVYADFDILAVKNNKMVSVGTWIQGVVTLT